MKEVRQVINIYLCQHPPGCFHAPQPHSRNFTPVSTPNTLSLGLGTYSNNHNKSLHSYNGNPKGKNGCYFGFLMLMLIISVASRIPPGRIEGRAKLLATKRRSKTLNGPKMAPRWPRGAQDGPKMAQYGTKMAPRWPQDGPRWPKMAPSWPQRRPRWAPNGPKRGPKSLPNRSSKAFQHRSRKKETSGQSHRPISADFWALLGPMLGLCWAP